MLEMYLNGANDPVSCAPTLIQGTGDHGGPLIAQVVPQARLYLLSVEYRVDRPHCISLKWKPNKKHGMKDLLVFLKLS